MHLEATSLDTVDILSIREQYDDLDLLGNSLEKDQQEPIIVGLVVGANRQVSNENRRVLAARKKGIKKLTGIVSEHNLTPYERSMAAIGILGN